MEILYEFWFISIPVVWSIIYIYYKKGSNKVLFVASVIGIIELTIVLLYVAIIPVVLFLVKVVPYFQESGLAIYIYPVIDTAEFISKWYWLVLLPVLSVFLPVLIYRKYLIFHKHPM